jgi:prepilin-type N-terminal cleavage/methylation domain-containing protein
MCRQGFSLVELLVVLSVIALLSGLLIAGVLTVRRSAKITEARSTLSLLHTAFDTYRQEDAWHRYPSEDPVDATISSRPIASATQGVLELLELRHVFAAKAGGRDGDGRLLDPWQRPWRYTLTRPAVAALPHLPDWNWDAAAGHERRWGRRRDPVTGTTSEGALAFPYIRSLGESGDDADPTQWILLADGS